MVFPLCVQADASLTLSFPQRPFRTQHKRVHEDRVYADASSLQSCLGTFCYSPAQKYTTMDKCGFYYKHVPVIF